MHKYLTRTLTTIFLYSSFIYFS